MTRGHSSRPAHFLGETVQARNNRGSAPTSHGHKFFFWKTHFPLCQYPHRVHLSAKRLNVGDKKETKNNYTAIWLTTTLQLKTWNCSVKGLVACTRVLETPRIFAGILRGNRNSYLLAIFRCTVLHPLFSVWKCPKRAFTRGEGDFGVCIRSTN